MIRAGELIKQLMAGNSSRGLTQKQIAQAFSSGDFEKAFPYLSHSIDWRVIDNYDRKGRKEVMEYCKKTAAYFATLTTDFKKLDVIESADKIAVTGTAELSENGKRIQFISACDVYEFNDQKKLQQITSYCVVQKD
jgi:predicted ester cyclase